MGYVHSFILDCSFESEFVNRMVGKLKFKKNGKSVHALHLNLNRSCKKLQKGRENGALVESFLTIEYNLLPKHYLSQPFSFSPSIPNLIFSILSILYYFSHFLPKQLGFSL